MKIIREKLRYLYPGDLEVINGEYYRIISRDPKTGNNQAIPLTEKDLQELQDVCEGIIRQGAERAHCMDDP